MVKHLWLLGLCILLLTGPVKAEYYTITRYQINLFLTEEGQADFEEVIEVLFSEPRHGLFRFIPYRFDKDGKRTDFLIRDVSVDGYKFSTYKENDNLIIKIGDPDSYVDGRQVYRIRYRVVNPILFYEAHSELYWDILGVSSPVDIDNITFRIVLPDQVDLSTEHVKVFSGGAGTTSHDIELKVQPREINGAGTRKFLPGEGVTVAIWFPEDTFQPMSPWASFLERHSLLFAPVLFILGGLLARFYARNRRQTIMTEYFPPEGISPAIAGGFVDHSVDNSDVLCLIPHLANHGYLRLEATEGGFLRKSSITFFKLKDAGPELFSFEKDFFNALFSSGDEVRLHDLKDKFYTHMAAVKSSVSTWIKSQGWYEPDQKAMGCFTALAGIVALAWGAYAAFQKQNTDGFFLMASGLLLFFFASRFNKRSPAGNKTYQKLEGFRQFVKKAERPVIERLIKEDPMYYDKTMPFALAFGYLKQWNNQFDGLLTQPPSWYSSPGMYGAGMTQSWNTFSQSFPSEINSMSSVFSSSPSSSGSGGGGGGGFSGGGGGGGGTGSW